MDFCKPSLEIVQKPEESDGTLMKNNGARQNCSHLNSEESIESVQRKFRRFSVHNFRREYKFEDGRKTCICSNGTYSWPDKCYDLLWVAVHGMNSICMVTRRQDVDMTRVAPFYRRYCTNQQTMRSYATNVISEVECLPYDDELRERFGQSIEKPFGVVSVIPVTKKSHEETGQLASSVEYDEEKAINFLTEKVKSDLEFTVDETIQTAISAFQHLCLEELKAEDIWVTTARNASSSSHHLHLHQRKEHMAAVISGGSSGGHGGSSGGRGGSPLGSGGGSSGEGIPTNFFDVLMSIPVFGGDRPCSCRFCRRESHESFCRPGFSRPESCSRQG